MVEYHGFPPQVAVIQNSMKIRCLIVILGLSLCSTLQTFCSTPDPSDTTFVRFNTNFGHIDVLMLTHEAPLNVANFRSYFSAYTNSVIHRSATIAQSGVAVIQGGGFFLGTDGFLLDSIVTTAPVNGEPGFSNTRGTLALALPSDNNGNPLINQGTSQWYFNVTDNTTLDANFTVFGVIEDANSLAVMDQISQVSTYNFGGALSQLPLLAPYTMAEFNLGTLPTLQEFVTIYSITPLVMQDFTIWQAANFTGQPAGSSDATATPQRDGITNLVKYFCDINPSGPMSTTDRAKLPTVGKIINGGTTYLTLTYHQSASATGVTGTVQTSTDLQTWTPLSPSSVFEIGSDSTTGDAIMQAQVAVTDKQFIRLSVSQTGS